MANIIIKNKSKQGSEVSGWDFTLKYDEDNEEQQQQLVELLKQITKKYVFQLELSETGYKHFQGRMRLIKKIRLTGLRKLFVDYNGIHLSRTVNKTYNGQSFSYVMKVETRVEGTSPICDTDPIPEYIPIQYQFKEWFPWQRQLLDLVENDESGRKIFCIIDSKGNSGKTYFSMRLCCTGKCQYIPPINDSKDIMRMCYDLPTSKMYIIDMTRSMNKDKLFGIYSAVEMLKNGLVYDDRYGFKRRFIDSPSVIIMTNEVPDMKLLSSDRWVLKTITNNNLVDYIKDDLIEL